jgi:hypothetical protein
LDIDIFRKEASFQRREDVRSGESAKRGPALNLGLAVVRSLAEDGIMDRILAIRMGSP